MQLYVDTSALVKLVIVEAESAALRRYFEHHSGDAQFTAALARTELVRAVVRQGSIAVIDNARLALSKLDLVAVTHALLDAAATIAPPEFAKPRRDSSRRCTDRARPPSPRHVRHPAGRSGCPGRTSGVLAALASWREGSLMTSR